MYFLDESNARGVFRDSANPTDTGQLAQMMLHRPERKYTSDDLAEKIHLNKYYLIKKFKQDFGLPPRQFLIQSRVRSAQRLLRDGAMVADVSAVLGFYDQSHFDKNFHRIVGISPIEFVNAKDVFEKYGAEN